MHTKRIILAEDDEEDVDLFKIVLNDLSVEVNLQVATNGIELMKMLEGTGPFPNLIFLDLNMPLKNGIICLEEIRTNKRWNNISVIILSTSSHQDQIKAGYEKGADFYMVKLSNYIDFKNVISSCLHKNWLSNEFK